MVRRCGSPPRAWTCLLGTLCTVASPRQLENQVCNDIHLSVDTICRLLCRGKSASRYWWHSQRKYRPFVQWARLRDRSAWTGNGQSSPRSLDNWCSTPWWLGLICKRPDRGKRNRRLSSSPELTLPLYLLPPRRLYWIYPHPRLCDLQICQICQYMRSRYFI